MEQKNKGSAVPYSAGIVERLRSGQDNVAYPNRDYMLEAADVITDLLEALSYCVAVMTVPVAGMTYGKDPAWYRALDQARAAIAKVRGEQP